MVKRILTDPVTKAEVFAALNTMKPYKAPSPDGFQTIFYKQYWHILGEDIFQLVKTSFSTGYFDPAISDTLISLIPKIDSPNSYKDFRPINLCNIVYKIITKVLALRLRPLLDSIIGPYQSSFLPGRGTSNNVVVLQEIIHFMRKSNKKRGFATFKLDLEKAFDIVNWAFLKSCLQNFGFPDITITLIMHCVTSSSLSILWNGNKLPPSTWKSSPLPSTKLFFKVIETSFSSQTTGLDYLIFFLLTTSFSSPKQKILNSDSSLIYLTVSVGPHV